MFSYSDENLNFHHSINLNTADIADKNKSVHAHKQNEIFYFLQGKASYLVEGHIYKLVPGSIMIMRSGEFHKVQILSDAPYERMALHFDDSILKTIDPEHKLLEPFYNRPLGVGNYFSPNSIKGGRIYECLKSIDSSPDDDEMRRIAISANLYAILYEIKIAYIEKEKENVNKRENTLAGEIIAYINANLASDLSLDILSSKFFISKNHLNRIFKAASGITVWEYVKLKRLLFARASILDGVSAATACENSGFKDYSAFYRAYKKQFGASPREKLSGSK